MQVDGTTSQSIVAQLLERMDKEDSLDTSEELDIVKNVALTSYAGTAQQSFTVVLAESHTDVSLTFRSWSGHRSFVSLCVTSSTNVPDTQTYATLQTFFMAMAVNPDVQKKAQAELDAVVGPDRLPDHSDRADLPYINALVKEALRWAPVLPFSIPHGATEDIEYDGYFIPAGTILIPNTW